MEKRTVLGWLFLFIAVVALLSCATVKPVTQADLPDLKGKWKGFYQSRGGAYTQAVKLEIFNEELRGNWTWHHADREPNSFQINGLIENGRIMYSWPGGQVNLSLRKGKGIMRLEGDYQIERYEGPIYLDKIE